MSNSEIITNIYNYWKVQGEKLLEHYKDNKVATQSINWTLEEGEEIYNRIIQRYTYNSDEINKCLLTLEVKTKAQINLCFKVDEEPYDTFFDVWICQMDGIEEVLDIKFKNYVVTHLHTDLSNGVTNIDSITKFEAYIDKAVELGMKAIAFTEHGNIFRHVKKRNYCKKKGIKYIHGVETYVTETLDNKVRDNYHCCLYAKNLQGYFELNRLMSHKCAFNRNDNHFYYTPRISFEELINTSDNIIISTACLGGILHNGNEGLKSKFRKFLTDNKHRCFLEIQHHNVHDQTVYNKELYDFSQKSDIPLIVGTDTHALNETHVKGRKILQESKDIFFDNEDGWDLTFKSYDELVGCYSIQSSNIAIPSQRIPMDEILKAIDNTNVLADMVEEYELDDTPKFPKLYDNPIEVFKQKINEGIVKRGIDKYPNYKEKYLPRILEEFETYKKCNAVDYMLLQDKILTDAREQANVRAGYGRGSVNGSLIAYILGITEMDSVEWDLLFFRFMNPHRISLPDIDIDYGEKDREWVMNYMLKMEGLNASLIITFNTIALKGACRDVGRYMKKIYPNRYNNDIIDHICKEIDNGNEPLMRVQHEEMFEYVDILQGTIVSVGSHPCGVVLSEYTLDDNLGTCMLKDNEYPVSMVDMKEIDGLNFIKMDNLGLDTTSIINETCDLVGIPRITPKTIDIYDEAVWKSIIEDTTNIFQMESDMAHQYLKEIMADSSIEKIKEKYPNIRKFDLFQLVCSMIRPAGSSMRDFACKGICNENGIKELDDMLEDTLGYVLLQEQIMRFLVLFCDYSESESDTIRRAIGKKTGTEGYIDEIRSRFMAYTPKKYNVDNETANTIIGKAIETILLASDYGFSKNHNVPYSLTGYIAGYLRHYYPLEFATSALNTWTFKNKSEKINETTEYMVNHGIKILPPRFRYSRAEYFMDKETNSIFKGIASIKYLNSRVAEELYELRDNEYSSFTHLLQDLQNTSIDTRQLGILIKIGFFEEFGKTGKLLSIVDIFNIYVSRKTFKKNNLPCDIDVMRLFSGKETEKQFSDIDQYGLIRRLTSEIEDKEANIEKILKCHFDNMGTSEWKNDCIDSNVYYVVSVETKYKDANIMLYNLNRGTKGMVKLAEAFMEINPIAEGEIIELYDFVKKPKKRKIDGKWQVIEGEFTIHLCDYYVYNEENVEELTDLINRGE